MASNKSSQRAEAYKVLACRSLSQHWIFQIADVCHRLVGSIPATWYRRPI